MHVLKRLLWILLLVQQSFAQQESPLSDLDHFESRVRPILVERCLSCHGEKKQWNDLRLDSRSAVLRGGEAGPAVVPGDAEASLLVRAIERKGELQMPPENALSSVEIDAVREWIARGAPWPKERTPRNEPHRRPEDHWAFQPLRSESALQTAMNPWCINSVDAFVWKKLQEQGLSPSPPADKRTLLRRVKMDLLGLLPTNDEVEQFAKDTSSDAYEKKVLSYLSSPHYGEHSARKWLDIARYSDTKGYVYAREERFFVHASTYRDWVVRAFNDDLPYDHFLRLQIAADQAAKEDPAQLAAMGFLTLGRRFLGVTHDIIDDRIDVVTRGTMGLSVACARCHDHKYDPIPTKDYYSLYGVFQNCYEKQVDLSSTAGVSLEQEYALELDKRLEKLLSKLKESRKQASDRVRSRAGDYLFAQSKLSDYPAEGFDTVLTASDLIPMFVRRWEHSLAALRRDDPLFCLWFRMSELPAASFAERAKEVHREWLAEKDRWNEAVIRCFPSPPLSLREVADGYQKLFLAHANPDAEIPPSPSASAIDRFLFAPSSPCEVPDEDVVNIEYFFDLATCTELWKLQGEVDRWRNQSKVAYPMASALFDRADLRAARVFRRGNPANKEGIEPPHFLSLFPSLRGNGFEKGSGRLELAEAIVHPENPLTPRVWVNRLWMQHFGEGLVRTPSDFGMRAEEPSHPELLDWLAQTLIQCGWRTKQLHYLMVTSATYRQASNAFDRNGTLSKAWERDPENRYLWRMAPRRLQFEELRDAFLDLTSELDRSMGGRASELLDSKKVFRKRSLYGRVDRQFLPTTLRVFDFANPDLHIPKRAETYIPQQSLFFLNHPWIADRVRQLARPFKDRFRSEWTKPDLEAIVDDLYRKLFQRAPSEGERLRGVAFLQSASLDEPTPIPQTAKDWKYGYGEVKEEVTALQGFTELPFFSGTAWQGSSQYPDSKLGWVQLTAAGGHPGNDLKRAAVRRWMAPQKMKVRLVSRAQHEPEQGDGIRCHVLSSRQGLLKSEALFHQEKQLCIDSIEVEAGDSIDFIVDIGKGLNSDQFLWSPRLIELLSTERTKSPEEDRIGNPSNQVEKEGRHWDAAKDFFGPPIEPLSSLEQYIQALLSTNEFFFLD